MSSTFALAALLVAGTSSAGNVTLNEFNIARKNPDSSPSPLRDQSLNPTWLSRQDCLEDLVISFPLGVSDYQDTNRLEVWVGDEAGNCKEVTDRSGTAPKCWKVGSADATSDHLVVDIRVRDMLGRHKATEATYGPGSGILADCTPTTSASTSPVPVNVNFLFVTSAGTHTGIGAYWSTKYDLWGPAPPTNLSLGFTASDAVLNWVPSADTDVRGYRLFCAQAEQTTAGQSCSSSKLVPGVEPDLSLWCGVVNGAAATSGVASGLPSSGAALAVAAVDSVGNVGKLSKVVCGQPGTSEVSAESTGCSVRPVRDRTGLLGLGLLALSLVVTALRRKQ